MQIAQLVNKRVAIIGMGLTGQSCARFLLRNQIVPEGFDTRDGGSVELDIPCHFGDIAKDALLAFDVVVLSPGLPIEMPAIQQALKSGVPVIGDIELFACNNNKPVIGVTGSNGKSTVVSMLAAVMAKANINVAIGGNIGIPALDLLTADFDMAVLELSSFQLETVRSLRLRVAALLNVSEDHMDRYRSFDHYRAAKHNIFSHADFTVACAFDANTLSEQRLADAFICNKPNTHGFGLQFSPLAITRDDEPFLLAEQMQVAGIHNLMNAQAVAIIAGELGIADDAIKAGLSGFIGLPHRCQKVAKVKGVTWVNDSKATNVGAAIAAIEGLRPAVKGKLWLIAGGDAKNANLTPLADFLSKDVDNLLVIGRDAGKFAELHHHSVFAESLEDAVAIAAKGSVPDDLVLLSPACASLDMFANYEQRGAAFVKAVEALV